MNAATEFILAGMLFMVVLVTTYLQYYQLNKSKRMMDLTNLSTMC